jgi:hypothetical protein
LIRTMHLLVVPGNRGRIVAVVGDCPKRLSITQPALYLSGATRVPYRDPMWIDQWLDPPLSSFFRFRVTIMMSSVIFAHSDDCVPMSHVASSIHARDLDLVHMSIRSFPLSAIGHARPQFDVMRVDDPIVPSRYKRIAAYCKTATPLIRRILHRGIARSKSRDRRGPP